MKKGSLLFLLLVVTSALFSQGYKVGDKAADFKLKNVDGKMVSLSDYKEAKGFIVIFTCNPCPYAIAYEDRIIALDKEFKSKGYPVIAVNPNSVAASPEDSFEKMVVRSKEKGFTYPYLFDEKHTVYKTYGATKTPHVFILNKVNGDLVVSYTGTIDNNYKDASSATEHYVKSAVVQLMSGKMPEPATTKAIGCSVKE